MSVTYHNKICPVCNVEFSTKRRLAKCCSKSCGSKLKYINRPELILMYKEHCRAHMINLNKSGLAYRMSKGKHTEEFKKKASERSKLPKSEKTKELIKQNHWAADPEKRKATVEKIVKTRRANPNCNTEESRYRLVNLIMADPEKYNTNKFYKRGRLLNITNDQEEYYASGFEKSLMEEFNLNKKIKIWTRHHGIIIYYMFNKKQYKYYPDFLVTYYNGRVELIEAKGRIFNVDQLKAKIKFAKQYCSRNGINKFKMIFQNKKHAKNF